MSRGLKKSMISLFLPFLIQDSNDYRLNVDVSSPLYTIPKTGLYLPEHL